MTFVRGDTVRILAAEYKGQRGIVEMVAEPRTAITVKFGEGAIFVRRAEQPASEWFRANECVRS
jgi:ribosomal protein L24